MTANKHLMLIMNTYKGWFYVIVTSTILYCLIRNLLKKVETAENELKRSNEELYQANEELQASLEQLAAAEEELRVQYEQITENEIKLIESEAKNRAIIQAMPDLLFLIDREGTFVDCIASDETLLLMPRKSFIGKKISDIIPRHISKSAYEKIESVFQNGNMEIVECNLLLSEEEQYFELRMMAYNQTEILVMSRNVTNERKSQIELKISEAKYKTLIKQLQLGLALYEGPLCEKVKEYLLVETNDSHERLTGLKTEDILGKTFGEIFPFMESENIEKLEHTISTGEPTYYERYQPKIDVYYEIIAYRPKESQLAIIVNDITLRRQAEKATRISENNFKNIFENSSDAILMVREDKVIDCNSAAIKLLGYRTKEELISKSPTEFSPEKQPNGALSKELVEEIYRKSHIYGKYKFEWWHRRNDGEHFPVEVMMTNVSYDGKEVAHCLCRDISERKQLEDNLKYLSIHDQLTGLYNRRFFEEEIVRLDTESSLPFTITMADINGLKLVNDSFGHAIGDELLRKVTSVLKKGCREQDIICRLSGDEFVIMSPNTDTFEAELIIKKIKSIAMGEKVGLVNISISFGFETKRNKDEPIYEILKKAENYMYRKKLYDSPSMRGKTIQAIISTLHEKNKREEQHSRRVSELCESMGNALHMPEDKVKELKTVGLLHDIGKIAIEENILNKKHKLTEEEWEEIKKHPEIGYRILSTVNDLAEMAEYVLAHHERWDGKGYPKGLQGTDIPLQSCIISIVDAYDAMISERSYRNALPKEVAIQELRANAGLQFNPELVEVFIDQVLEDEL
ncbi:diguanylate cyclase [Clostridium aminobutyricum]|uniref:Diguanylate cyclase n=2 Tax=Clostridium aminobutyricum TaxID=33953 RepID=A0A939D7L6_CLOAM|nr:diguanylate cyclase [Clostridium aminobutyricum]